MKKSLQISVSVLMAFSSLIFACSANADYKGSLTVVVNGLRNQKGLLCIKVFSKSQGFPSGNEKTGQGECIKITEEPMKYSYKKLTAGSYAVAVFHDQNGDRTLNRNGIGIPTEGYGFSKNPVVRTGPPNFGQAVFLVAGPNTNIQIQMQYGN